nr:hypothetical protein CFP56_78775 [Quercus suber]
MLEEHILLGGERRWQRQLEGIGENSRHWQNLRHRFRGDSLADPDELCDFVEPNSNDAAPSSVVYAICIEILLYSDVELIELDDCQ